VTVLGVDGWRSGWVGARLDGRRVQLLALPDVAAVLAVPEVAVVGIDMPIGPSEDGARACDVLARDLLRRTGAASSVFPAPVRAVLATDDHAEARQLSRDATGGQRAPSAQSFQLVRSIRALDDAVGVPMIDALDACAAAWSAQRLADGTAEHVGDGTTDARGRPMRVCW